MASTRASKHLLSISRPVLGPSRLIWQLTAETYVEILLKLGEVAEVRLGQLHGVQIPAATSKAPSTSKATTPIASSPIATSSMASPTVTAAIAAVGTLVRFIPSP
jgi:hypothetical protein